MDQAPGLLVWADSGESDAKEACKFHPMMKSLITH
jgi:hypothetical protein